MAHWSSLKIWSRISDQLSVAVGREFEKALLPWMQVIWPELRQPPEIGAWDKKGIDLLAWADRGPFSVVIQCKGYEVQSPGKVQLRNAKESIVKFHASGYTAKLYVLAYNRPGSDREFHTALEKEAGVLVRNGIVERAEVWSREIILHRIFDAMAEKLNKQLIKSADILLARLQHLSEFHIPFLDRVPIRESELIFRRYEPCKIRRISELRLRSCGKLILDSSDSRWTLLVGVFGAGKTTSALHAATSGTVKPIFVPAKALPPDKLRTGTSTLLIEVLRVLGLYASFEWDDKELVNDRLLLEKMAGSVLGALLRKPGSGYLIVIDGLDENRAYCSLEGVQHLSNQLAELRCPIVLTTRKEQLAEQFGNFSAAMTEASAKYGPGRTARLLEMEPWEPRIVTDLVNQTVSQRKGKEASHLKEFVEMMETSKYKHIYGELPTSPLFLSFILEDVAEFGIRKSGRAEIVRGWVKRKIRRDRASVERLSPDENLDLEALVVRVLAVLREAAGVMVEETERGCRLTESIEEQKLSDIATKTFHRPMESLLPILLNSVLIPLGYRNEHDLKIGFVYQMLQEYFLAEFLIDCRLPYDTYPSEVRDFCRDIQSEAYAS